MIDIRNIRWERKKQAILQYLRENPVVHKGLTVVSALGINYKHAGFFALIPENLDLEAHIQHYPLTNYKFVDTDSGIRPVNMNGTLGLRYDIERMYHIISLITSARADSKDEIGESGFVPIHSRRIRHYFKDYLSYLDYLIVTGIIICDRQYIVDERPREYKLAPEYENVLLIPHYYTCFNPISVNPIEELVYNEENNSFERNALLDKEYLSWWYKQKKIDIHPFAEKYSKNVWKSKIGINDSDHSKWDISDKWDVEKHCYPRKDPKLQYNAVTQNINEIKIHHYKAKIDANVHRLSSVLTNIQSEYRNYMTYDGQELVAIDIKNSQPYLLCLLLNKEFWMENSALPININNLSPNIQRLYKTPPEILSTIQGFFELVNITEFQEYINLVASGMLYEIIIEIAKQIRKSTKLNRKKAKKNLLTFFYSANKDDIEGVSRRTYIIEKVFREKFPTIMRLIRLIKNNYEGTAINNTYNRFSRLLQSVESEIVLNRCCKRIWDEGHHKVPIFTIHDSIATTYEYQDYVKRIMEDELTKAVGVKPTLKIETWHISNLDKYPFPKFPAVIYITDN